MKQTHREKGSVIRTSSIEKEVRSHPHSPSPASSSSPKTEVFLPGARPPPEGVRGGSL